MSSIPELLRSHHLSSRTRTLLSERLTYQKKYPQLLSEASFSLLKSICDDVLPQRFLLPQEQKIDLATLIDQSLHGLRDGWRFVDLPSDEHAWEVGLQTIAAYAHAYYGQSYEALPLEKRGELLDTLHDGRMKDILSRSYLTPHQMMLWSGDLRSDIISHFLSHPVAQNALAISAELTGNDRLLHGFEALGFNRRDAFECWDQGYDD